MFSFSLRPSCAATAMNRCTRASAADDETAELTPAPASDKEVLSLDSAWCIGVRTGRAQRRRSLHDGDTARDGIEARQLFGVRVLERKYAEAGLPRGVQSGTVSCRHSGTRNDSRGSTYGMTGHTHTREQFRQGMRCSAERQRLEHARHGASLRPATMFPPAVRPGNQCADRSGETLNTTFAETTAIVLTCAHYRSSMRIRKLLQ